MPAQKPNSKILILSEKWGHLSQAEATSEIFARYFGKKNVRLVCPNPQISHNFYHFFYLYLPSLFRLPFRIARLDQIRTIIKYYGKKYLGEVTQIVESFRPGIICTTHFIFHEAVEKILSQKQGLKFLNLVSDPITIHPIIFSQQAINLVYNQHGVKLGKKYGLEEKQIIPIGWLVRKQFYQKQPPAILRKKIKLDPHIFTLLICGGSEGTNTVLKILPALLKAKKPLQVIIVAGKNTVLYQVAKSFEKLFSSSVAVWESRLKIKTFRFVKNLANLIQASDLVVGKAGPNLIFETVACERPFFAITHIHGQEDGNLQLIKKKKLGWVEENGEKAGKLLLKIIQKPAMAIKWQKHILKEKAYIQSAEKKLLACIT